VAVEQARSPEATLHLVQLLLSDDALNSAAKQGREAWIKAAIEQPVVLSGSGKHGFLAPELQELRRM
jgi:hypothetical protein